ncbi:MAG: SusD/RagB family nutrient-binding outer membrane lipoprotein [Tannerellaceae bacterium]|nr:SusD/RagB family nutrient-binding outer membrane lipoprotein [Tannerellaceae bacterium]
MKQNIFKLLLIGLVVSFTSCHDFEDLNTDKSNLPYVPGEVDGSVSGEGIAIDYELSDTEIDELKTGLSAIPSIFANFTYDGAYNDYQITTNLTHDIYAGYFANNTPSFHESSPTYVYRDDWSKRRWEHFYDDRTAAEYAQLIKTFYFVDRDYYKNVFYITRIYYAFLLSMHTDTYGDVPTEYYVKGLLPPDLNVKYTKQSEVYNIIFQLLDEAITMIDPDDASQFMFDAGDDRCFQGDIRKWLRFANTLRLRCALRISNADPETARTQGEAALLNDYGLMQSNADNMRTVPKYAPVAQGGTDDGGSENIYCLMCFDWAMGAVMTKDLSNAYNGQSSVLDARCEVLWWRPSPYEDIMLGRESTNSYNGMRVGDPEIHETNATQYYSVIRKLNGADQKQLDPNHWFSYARAIVWLGYAESLFLRAEAALRSWNGADGTAEELFKAGIRASFDYYGVGAQAETYINNLKTDAFNGNDREAMLEQIITQKWLAVFPNGNEGWAEFRRTDYPALLNIVENNSDGDVPANKFIKRIKYPDSEGTNENRPADNSQGTRVWWDIADTNDDSGQRRQPNNFQTFSVSSLFK